MHRFEARDIRYTYAESSTPALAGVDFSMRPGEIYALVGENGAGKSTLAKAMCGLLPGYGGTFLVDDGERTLSSPSLAEKSGIGMVPQRSELADGLTVAENVMIGIYPAKALLFVDKRRMRRTTAELGAEFGFDLDPDARVSTLTLAQRREVELLRAAARGADLLILDEPSAQLGPDDVGNVFRIVRKAARSGRIIVYISHRMDEVIEIADTVLRLSAGKLSGSYARGEFDASSLSEARTAEPAEAELSNPSGVAAVGEARGRPPLRASDPVATSSRGGAHDRARLVLDRVRLRAHPGGGVYGLDLALGSGDMATVVGVSGNGMEALESLISGMAVPDSGRVLVCGSDPGKRRGLESLRGGDFAYLPSDRERYGAALGLSCLDNALARERGDFPPRDYARNAFSFLASLFPRYSRWFSKRIVRAREIMGTDSAFVFRKAGQLSGGMRQRLVMGRELSRDPKFALAVNPAQGMDSRSRTAVLLRLKALAAAGGAVLVLTPSIDDALALGAATYVMYRGALVPCERDESRIAAALGGASS